MILSALDVVWPVRAPRVVLAVLLLDAVMAAGCGAGPVTCEVSPPIVEVVDAPGCALSFSCRDAAGDDVDVSEQTVRCDPTLGRRRHCTCSEDGVVVGEFDADADICDGAGGSGVAAACGW